MANKSKNQAKDAIRALCHIMNASGFITSNSINPEHFRQGKFDKSEAVAPLARFLLELIGQKKMSPSHKAFSDDRTVKSILGQIGFLSADPSKDEESELSSRDVLLCLGWTLARSDLVNKVVRRLLENSSRLLSLSHLHSVSPGETVKLEPVPAASHMSGMARGARAQPSVSGLGEMRYLVWLVGRLRLTLKALHSEQWAICRHLYRVHDSTQGAGVPQQELGHLSALDAFVLRHPKLTKNYYEELEKAAAILQACLSWQELEPVFWQWMVSVCEARQVSGTETSRVFPSDVHPTSVQTTRLSDPKSTSRVSQLCKLESSLGQVLLRVQSDIASKNIQQFLLEVHCPLDAAKTKADVENIVKTRLACNMEELLKSGHSHYPLDTLQFSYRPDRNKHRQKLKIENPQRHTVDVRTEILRLTECTRKLQRELEELREEQQERLSGFAECLNNVVCIPPMSEKRW